MIPQQSELAEIARKTVVLYNRLRGPEAFAKIIKVEPQLITIAFSGTFCVNCSVVDYLEGFAHEFKALSSKFDLKIGKTRQTSVNSFEADYDVKPR